MPGPSALFGPDRILIRDLSNDRKGVSCRRLICERGCESTYVIAKKALCRLDTSAYNDCLTTKVIGVPEEDKAETLRRLVGNQSPPEDDQQRHQAAEKDFDVSRNINTHQVPLIDPIQSQMTWAAGTGYAKPSGTWFTICYRYLFFGINGLISLFGLFLIGSSVKLNISYVSYVTKFKIMSVTPVIDVYI